MSATATTDRQATIAAAFEQARAEGHDHRTAQRFANRAAERFDGLARFAGSGRCEVCGVQWGRHGRIAEGSRCAI